MKSIDYLDLFEQKVSRFFYSFLYYIIHNFTDFLNVTTKVLYISFCMFEHDNFSLGF